MTADERLDQLEPLLSEALTVLDRHTYQLKQLNSAVGQLNSAFIQLSNTVGQLINTVEQLSNTVGQLVGTVSQLANVATQQGDNIGFLLREQLAMKTQQDQMDGKLDQILQLLQRPGQ